MTINVTQQDIGTAEICGDDGEDMTIFCPVAVAVRRSVGVQRIVRVNSHRGVNIDSAEIALPERASNFIIAFDNMRPVKPFTFELPLETVTT